MAYDFNNDRPIYIQLIEQLELSIISGELLPGDRLLSVREYANKYKVNPNTMQKALLELEDKQLIYTERTNGKYVTNNKKIIEKYRSNLAQNKLKIFLDDMHNIGLSNDEIIKYIEGEK